MCTLILGWNVVGPNTVLVGANRDESPLRPSDPPRVLSTTPPLAGGRDRNAGGTWLAVRDRHAVVAVLNRRGDSADGPASGRRSRGLLTLEVAGAPLDFDPAAAIAAVGDAIGPGLARAALARALTARAESPFAPFSLVYASPTACWILSHAPGDPPRVVVPAAGWHVLTHTDLDDPDEPRTAWLLRGLAAFHPATREAAERGVVDRLASHGADGGPPVCLHDGPMVTVSASLVWLDATGARYRHAEGRPCERPFEDRSPLLGEESP